VGAAIVRAAAKPGAVKLAFSGRIGGRRLASGRYRFVATAFDAAGNRSAPRTAAFSIIR
jgi:hypothetical protein